MRTLSRKKVEQVINFKEKLEKNGERNQDTFERDRNDSNSGQKYFQKKMKADTKWYYILYRVGRYLLARQKYIFF